MQKKWLISIMVLFLAFALTACSSGGNETLVSMDKGKVTKDDLYKEMKKTSGKQLLQNLTFEKMLENKYDVSDKLDKQMKQAKKQFKNDDQFENALKQQGYQNKSQFKDSMKQQLLMQKATTDGVKVSDKEMKKYYKKNKDQFAQVNASHIAVDKKKKANSIKNQLDDGADFGKLAKKNSTDKDTAKKDGKLGKIDANSQDVDPQLMQKALGMKEGKVSKPFQTQTGYEIVKVTKKTTKPFKDVKGQIKDTVKQQKAKSPFDVLKKLKKDQDVKVKDDDFKDALDIDKLKKQQQQQQLQQQLQQQQGQPGGGQPQG